MTNLVKYIDNKNSPKV